jgi:hypothetical protein
MMMTQQILFQQSQHSWSQKRIDINAWCAARRESAAKSHDDDDDLADTFPTVTTFLVTTKDRY